MNHPMKPTRTLAGLLAATTIATAFTVALATTPAAAQDNGVVRVKSGYSMEESIQRVKADVAAKGIMFFGQVDQSQLAAKAGIALRPSTLLEFGNPPLGTQFITANPDAGLDWPVRLLLTQDETGQVWAVWSDFSWIARRHGIGNRDAQFGMASRVVASITSTLRREP